MLSLSLSSTSYELQFWLWIGLPRLQLFPGRVRSSLQKSIIVTGGVVQRITATHFQVAGVVQRITATPSLVAAVVQRITATCLPTVVQRKTATCPAVALVVQRSTATHFLVDSGSEVYCHLSVSCRRGPEENCHASGTIFEYFLARSPPWFRG